MGYSGLARALQRGEPLIDVVVRLREGVDYADATRQINAVADDFDLHPGDWYGQPGLRTGTATRDALGRLFGWKFSRVPLERYDPATGAWGTWPDVYRWEELDAPDLEMFPVAGLIRGIECTQPGGDDDGRWWA